MPSALTSSLATFSWLTIARKSKLLRELTELTCLLLKILRQQQELLATVYLQLLRTIALTVSPGEHLPLTILMCLSTAANTSAIQLQHKSQKEYCAFLHPLK